MSDFRLGSVPSSSVLHVYSLRSEIWFNPPYQRQSDIWPLEKRQLLIDTILNGYDLPKLYFHEFFPAKDVDGKKYKYAIVDGKQRLESIFSFIEGKFALADDMEYISDPNVKASGLTYGELAKKYPDLKTKLDGFYLPIVSILAEDVDLIEDMFSRLNEAVPLNAAEKRNAFGGPIPIAVRTLVSERFFQEKLPFGNKRYRHFDLATKFLYILHKGQLVDTKKVHLDEFVRSFASGALREEADKLLENAREILQKMNGVFVDSDPLLRSVGSVILYFFLFLDAKRFDWNISRKEFVDFEGVREINRGNAEKGKKADFTLLEYDRLTQSPNDGTALKYRYSVLRRHVGPKDKMPEFSITE